MSSEVLTSVMKDVDRRMKPFEVPSMTFMRVERDKISAKLLACVGARCCTKTNPMPVSTGSA